MLNRIGEHGGMSIDQLFAEGDALREEGCARRVAPALKTLLMG